MKHSRLIIAITLGALSASSAFAKIPTFEPNSQNTTWQQKVGQSQKPQQMGQTNQNRPNTQHQTNTRFGEVQNGQPPNIKFSERQDGRPTQSNHQGQMSGQHGQFNHPSQNGQPMGQPNGQFNHQGGQGAWQGNQPNQPFGYQGGQRQGGQVNQPFPYQEQGGQRSQFNQPQAQPFAVGEKLPKDYRGKSHRIDYRTHGLPAPAKNQAWVEADGHYLLVNILTNAIVQVLLGN